MAHAAICLCDAVKLGDVEARPSVGGGGSRDGPALSCTERPLYEANDGFRGMRKKGKEWPLNLLLIEKSF